MRAIPLMMISALIPATSELGARNDRARILKAYLLASKYVAMVTIAIIALTVIESESVVRLWLGDGHGQLILLVQILAVGYGVNILGGAASQTGAGVGRPEFDMRSSVWLAVLSPAFALVLVQRFQVQGVAVGTSLALFTAAVILLWTFHRNYVETPFWETLREIYARPLVAGILANLAVTGFHGLVPSIGQLELSQFALMGYNMARFLILSKIILDFAVFAPVYVVLLIGLRQVTAMDWKNFVGLMTFADEDEAVALANDTDYGLAMGLWTSDLARSTRVAGQLRAGTVWINTYNQFDPAVPFGGRGQSGIGRELGDVAVENFTELKSVWVG